MPVHYRASSASRFYRILDIVCVLIVYSYVFFDVLDIDGSNFPRVLTPTQRFFLIAETVPVVDLRDFRELAVLSGHIARPFTDLFERYSRLLRETKSLRLSSLISIRIHGYRVGLPRDLVPD